MHVCVPARFLRAQHADILGPTQRVQCSHGHTIDRQIFQDMIAEVNPQWKTFLDDLERSGTRPRTNPDGDVRPSSYREAFSSK